jgi:SAM-dependent methyltransferase
VSQAAPVPRQRKDHSELEMTPEQLHYESNLYEPGNEEFYEIMYPPSKKRDIEYIETEVIRRVEGPVLELACGTGRVLLTLARHFPDRGFVGMDLLADQLGVCTLKAEREASLKQMLDGRSLRLVDGDMCRFDEYLPTTDKFGAIILCNSSFLHVKDTEDRVRLLQSVKKRLLPKGIFLLEYALTFWQTWGWDPKDIGHPQYLLYRRNVFDQATLTAVRFFRFEPRAGTGQSKTMYEILFLFDQRWLKDAIVSSGLKLIKEESCFEGEAAGQRKILFITQS